MTAGARLRNTDADRMCHALELRRANARARARLALAEGRGRPVPPANDLELLERLTAELHQTPAKG